MEDGLVMIYRWQMLLALLVLILIVVEDGLVPSGLKVTDSGIGCLNPYCSGRWSRTDFEHNFKKHIKKS